MFFLLLVIIILIIAIIISKYFLIQFNRVFSVLCIQILTKLITISLEVHAFGTHIASNKVLRITFLKSFDHALRCFLPRLFKQLVVVIPNSFDYKQVCSV